MTLLLPRMTEVKKQIASFELLVCCRLPISSSVVQERGGERGITQRRLPQGCVHTASITSASIFSLRAMIHASKEYSFM